MRYSEIFKEAERLHKLGWALHWLHPRSKRPVESGWTTGPRKTWKELSGTFKAGMNLGVRLGTPSKINGAYLAVIDVDVKSADERHRAEALAAVASLLPTARSAPRVASGRGNGSRHYYVLTERPFKTFNPAASDEMVKVRMPSKKASRAEIAALTAREIEDGWRLSRAWEVSLYSDGRQVVLPPSVHPDSGELYQWKRELTAVTDLPVLDLSGADAVNADATRVSGEAEGLHGSVSEAHPAAKRGAEHRSEAATQKLTGFKVEPVDLGWLPISDAVRLAIVEGRGVEDRSGYLLKASSALISAGLTQNEVLTVLTDPETFLGACGYDHAKTKDRMRAAEWVYRYTVQKVEAERSGEGVFGPASEMKPSRKLTDEEMEEQEKEFAEQRNWRQDLDRAEKGKVKVTLKNLDAIFTHGVEGTVFVEDLFASRIEYGVDTPWGGKEKTYIKDIDMIRIKRWLGGGEFNIEPATNAILEATSLVADRCSIHPVQEYLKGLKWDGKKRLDKWIKDYCKGNAEEPFLSEASRKFILAMVKRVFEPGCQWDYVLVLEGTQGKYKSSVARALAGDKWFMDNLPDLKDKDSMLNLQGKWLIELGELANVKRADFNLVKAYLVRRTDTVRPHYGRLMSDVPRQSVFIGTVNEGQYLKDPTGNRRYWPVKVGLCDVKGILKVRDQLFAEAMHIYQTTNEMLMLSPKAEAQAKEAQDDRRIDDDETEMRDAMTEFMETPAGGSFNFERFRLRDLTAAGMPLTKWAHDKYFAQTAAQVLRNLGFERKKLEGQRVWQAPKKPGHTPSAPPMPRSAPESDDIDFH